jgi:O-antigen ligase
MKNPAFWIVCLLVIMTPMFRGSVHAWAQTVIQAMVALGGIVVVLEAMRSKGERKRSSRSSSQKGFSTRQLFWYVALPCAALGIWSAVMSPYPALVVQGLIMLATYIGFFFLVVVSVRTREEQRALVWVVVGTAVFLGMVGLLELYDVLKFSWWDYSAETNNAYHDALTGAYVNRNHLAGFLEMAIPMLLIMFLTRSRAVEAKIFMISAALLLIVCQALTMSRGGWAGTAGALLFIAVILLLKKGFVHKRLVGGILAGIVVVAAIVFASTPVVERIATLTQRDMEDNLHFRTHLSEGTLNLIKDNLAAGTGPGTYTVAFPPYQEPGYAQLPRYAHNDYLQFTADAGILFIPLMLWLLYLFFKTGFQKFQSRSRQTSGIALGCMAAAIAILIHSYSDGNLQIPANALLFTSLSALTLKPE